MSLAWLVFGLVINVTALCMNCRSALEGSRLATLLVFVNGCCALWFLVHILS